MVRRLALLVLFFAACGGEDQRAMCTRIAHDYDLDRAIRLPDGRTEPPEMIERCVREQWSRQRAECAAKQGGMGGIFCQDL